MVFVSDSGVHGPASTAGDSFTIAVLNGPYGPTETYPGYSNSGFVQQGNITVLQGGDPIPPTP